MNFAIIVNGEPVLIRPQPITGPDGVQHPRSIFTLWSQEKRLAIGVYDVVRDPPQEGFRAASYSYALDGDVVRGTPIEEPIPPQPVFVTPEQLAELLAPQAQDGGGLVLGRWYPQLGELFTEEDNVVELATFVAMGAHLHSKSPIATLADVRGKVFAAQDAAGGKS